MLCFSARCYSTMSKTSSADHFKQINNFQTLRKTLLQNVSPADLERPLAYWAVAGDRRLPLAFLGRSLRDLLAVSFDELAATPGIGHKKISSLLRLLSRRAKIKFLPMLRCLWTHCQSGSHPDVQPGRAPTSIQIWCLSRFGSSGVKRSADTDCNPRSLDAWLPRCMLFPR